MIKQRGDWQKAVQELKNNHNNAVAHLFDVPRAEANANGPLAGLVVTIKDNYAIQGAPLGNSSLILSGFVPGYDATIVKKLHAAGAQIVAKTHCDEFGFGGTGTFSAYGLITNPLDAKRLVGGSSSGAAATFTKNIGLAIGSDTGDSVRLPASYCGLIGFKPSYGAISRYGLTAFAASLDTVAYFAHSVSDAISVARVLYGLDEHDFTTRGTETIALPTAQKLKPRVVGVLSNTEHLSKQVKTDYLALQSKLEADGVQIKTLTLDTSLLEAIDPTYMAVAFAEGSSNTANYTGIHFGNAQAGSDWKEIMSSTRSHGFGKMMQRRLTLGAFYLLKQNQFELFQKAQRVRRVIVEAFNALYAECDIVIFPAASAAPLISEGKAQVWNNAYLIHANFSGNPSIVLRWTTDEKMPVGLAVDAPRYQDAKLLSHALYLEALIGKHE